MTWQIFYSGIAHINVTSDTVPVNDIVTAVIGLVGTADKGDTNVLTLCKSAAGTMPHRRIQKEPSPKHLRRSACKTALPAAPWCSSSK